MIRFLGLNLTALVVLAGCAETRTCSIQVPVTTAHSEYSHLAQISRAAAEQAARDRLQAGPAGHIVAANLESDAGCLIWSVEVRMPGERGLSAVHVDAGDGRVLMVRHERDSGARSEPWFDE